MIAPAFHRLLRELAPGQRAAALREAWRTPFDVLELVGMAAGLITGLLLMRGGAAALAALAAPAAVAVFFAARRTYRGLSRMLAER